MTRRQRAFESVDLDLRTESARTDERGAARLVVIPALHAVLKEAREMLSHGYSNRQPPLEFQTTPARQRLLRPCLQAWERHDVVHKSHPAKQGSNGFGCRQSLGLCARLSNHFDQDGASRC